ncbi:MAG TPA: glycosyltransferase family 2 protein [Actinomycetota bacterium]|nr:glycosyltransferase family 2 protein [Actinomycetota bacterium]
MLGSTYVLPIKWSPDLDRAELAGYLERIAAWVEEVIVVDGSPEPEFVENARTWGSFTKHVRPNAEFRFLNGKVAGVTTGVHAARHENVVIADDDVRYDRSSLERVVALLEGAELVRPQNFFSRPMPWHAALDTSRSLLNRAFGGDFPGTLGIRRSFFVTMGGYDGNVLFENFELMRTVERHAGRVETPLDLYVCRLPPTTERFFSQRVRQAYDDFALPVRMGVWLATVPVVSGLLLARKVRWIAGLATAAVAVAETGRRKAGGSRVFPPVASLLAPLWLAERGVSSWLAVASRLRGGVRYGEVRIQAAANRTKVRRAAGLRFPRTP